MTAPAGWPRRAGAAPRHQQPCHTGGPTAASTDPTAETAPLWPARAPGMDPQYGPPAWAPQHQWPRCTNSPIARRRAALHKQPHRGQHGPPAQTPGMDPQHRPPAQPPSMDPWHGPPARTPSMDPWHGPLAWTPGRDPRHGPLSMDPRHRPPAWNPSTDPQHGPPARTPSTNSPIAQRGLKNHRAEPMVPNSTGSAIPAGAPGQGRVLLARGMWGSPQPPPRPCSGAVPSRAAAPRISGLQGPKSCCSPSWLKPRTTGIGTPIATATTVPAPPCPLARGRPPRWGCHHQHPPTPGGQQGFGSLSLSPAGGTGARDAAFLRPTGAEAAWPGSSTQLLPGEHPGPLAPLQSQIIFFPFCQIYCRKMGSDFFLILGWGEKYAAGRAEVSLVSQGCRPQAPFVAEVPETPEPCQGPANFLAPRMGSVTLPPGPSQVDDSKYFINHRSVVVSLIAAINGNVNGPY